MSKIRQIVNQIILQEMKGQLNENFNSIKSLIDKVTSAQTQRIELLQEKLSQYSQWIDEKSQVYEKNYNNMAQVLKRNGFEIEDVHYITATGFDGHDISKFDLKTEPQLKIEGKLKMVGSRKPFKDLGYTAHGSKKQTGHHSLSQKLSDDLESACPGMGFEVNPYSLQRPDNILFSMWVR
jgi:hypothetical protein